MLYVRKLTEFLIVALKALWQKYRILLPEKTSAFNNSYDEDSVFNQVRENIKERVAPSDLCKEQRFLFICPIVNWEVEIFEAAKKVFQQVSLLKLESSGFFDHANSWRKYVEGNNSKIVNFLNNEIHDDNLNIIFLYVSEFHCDPTILDQFKRHNTIVILFNWDDRLYFRSKHKGQSVGISQFVPAVDFCLSFNRQSFPRYLSQGGSVFFWHGTCSGNNSLNFAVRDAAIIPRVLFFGAKYGFRGSLVEYLRSHGICVDTFGQGWGTKVPSYEELVRLVPQYAVTLGISTIGYTRDVYCFKGRDIEVPMLGGLYLVNSGPQIEEVYNDTEVLTYNTPADCLAKIRCVLSNPNKFDGMREKGMIAAQGQSMYSRMLYLKDILQKLGAG